MFIHTYDEYWDQGHAVAAFSTSKDAVAEIRKWCYNVYGPPGYNHLTAQIRWKDYIDHGEVLFDKREDLSLFLLKWS